MDVPMPPGDVYFEDYRLDLRARKLLRCTEDGRFEPVNLRSRAYAILCTLVDRAGSIVSKDEIMAAVWPTTIVEDVNLTVQMSALRRVLDEGRREGSCIQTVAGRGYCFVPAVTRGGEALPEADVQPRFDQALPPLGHRIKETIAGGIEPESLHAGEGWGTRCQSAPQPGLITLQPADASDRRQSMIIMPFENSSGDVAQDTLAAQVTREVTNRILSAPHGAIIAGAAVQACKGKSIDPRSIGRKHDVHFMLTGNARRQEGRLIVSAVLYETAGGGPVWGRQLDMPDGPDTLPTLAQVIYESTWQKRVDVEAWHAARDRPHHPDKRDLILIALSTPLWCPTRANYLERLSLVDSALALDPHYLRGWERRARLLAEFVLEGHSSDSAADAARASEAADRALAIDAHAQLSLRVKAAALRASGQWAEAEAVQRRVLSLLPTESFRHYELGVILMAQGRHQEALSSFQTAKRSAGGNNPVYWYDGEIAMAYLAAGRFADAIATARLAIGEMPPNVGRSGELPWLALIAATSASGNDRAARADLRRFLATPRSWQSIPDVQNWPAFAANPNLLEGLRRAGIPRE